MKHYIDKATGQVYAYEADGSQDEFIPTHLEPISDADLAALRAPTPAQVQAALERAVQTHLDDAARALGYDDIATAVTYADEPAVPAFQAQGQALRAWRSLVWASCIATLANVNAGAGAPTAADLIASLPAAPKV